MISMSKIYFLHKGDNIPFYVGKTSQPLNSRLCSHTQNLGKNIKIELIEEVKNWKYWESFWIEQFKQWGFILLNQNKGGGGSLTGVSKHSLESREKISKSRIGIKYSDESKNKISKALKGKKQSKKTCDLKRIKRLGSNHSSLSKEKISENLSKPIFQCDKQGNLIKEWPSTKKAGHELNIQPSDITKCLKNRLKSAGSFIWKYKISIDTLDFLK